VHLFVFGSLAYDRIMTFGGRFADHILPEKIHMMNVCFTVNGLRENLGGTAGNIAYGLTLLDEHPRILGCLGKDGGRYLDYLKECGVDTGHIRVVDKEFTAGAYITTDLDNNQITGFNPGP
jgi:adenosine kinase